MPRVTELKRVATSVPAVIRDLERIKRAKNLTSKEFFSRWSAARKQIYALPEWRRFSLEIKKRSKNVCECCKKEPAAQIHHRERVYDNPRRILDKSNVLHVCQRCHDQAHEHY